MHQQSPNKPFDGIRDADVNVSQASLDIDMNFEDMSSQGNNQDNVQKSTGIKPTEVLQKALNKLRDKFSDFNPPTNEPDWQQLYENTLFKSKKHAISYEEHLWTWLQLITTAKKLKNTEQTLLNCYCNAISMLPIKIFEPDTTWITLINGLYSHIIVGEISETAASSVLETAENKFKYSPKHARVYWNAVLKNEKQLMKKSEKPPLEQQCKIVDLLKIRFSNPYLNMEEDYNEFARWSLDVNLNKDFRVEVQQAFLKHSRLRKMDFVTKILENTPEKTNKLKHHLLFEDWVAAICNEESPNYDNIEIICEEIIAAEPDSICYYWVFLNALASHKFEGINKREDKMYDVILRAYRLGKTSCEGMDQRFLEHSLVIASKTLCVGKVLELVEAAITNTQFTITNNTTKWYASSRGVIIAISNLVHAGYLEAGSLEKYFNKVIAPCTMAFFKNSVVPQELADKTGYETQYFELLRLWVASQESYFELPWEKTLQLWTDIFMNNENPIMLVGYVDFVKNRGKPKDALEATNFALGQMARLESSEVTPKCTTRRCYIKLLQDHLEILSATGNVDRQIETSKELQRKLNYYISHFTNEFRDLTTPGLLIKGFSPYESMWKSNSSESLKLSQESALTCDTNFSDNLIVNQLKSLKVDHDNDQSELESRDNGDVLKVTKIFVSNLSYHATEDDLLDSFKDKGFYPLKVEILKNPQGKSRGIAHVTFETKEAADLAVQLCDKFIVCGRVTFVSQFKSGQKFSVKKPSPNQPTLINLTNLPSEWKDEDKISNKLSCYGHVKSVVIEEHDDSSFTVRVEFHMMEDAQNAYDQIVETKIFGDSAMCRMGYASNKRQVEEKKSGKKMKGFKKRPKKSSEPSEMEVAHENNLETSPVSLPDSAGKNQHIGPQMPLGLAKEKPKSKPTKSFNLVPMQALKQDQPRVTKRTSMKARLDFGGSSASISSSASPNDSPVKKVMRMSGEEIKPHLQSTSDEAGLDGVSSQSSTSSTGSPSPQKKVMRMSTDVDVKQCLHTISEKCDSPNGDETPAQELEFVTNTSMEEEDNTNEKPLLTNKDFQRLFKKH